MGLPLCMPCSDEEATIKEGLLLGNNDSSSLLDNEKEVMTLFSQTQEEIVETGQESCITDIFNMVIRGKLDDTYLDCINLMSNKYTTKGNDITDDENILLINSSGGTRAFKSQKCVRSAFFFTLSLFTSKMLGTGTVTTGSSFNILTWLQVIANENLKLFTTVLPQDFWD